MEVEQYDSLIFKVDPQVFSFLFFFSFNGNHPHTTAHTDTTSVTSRDEQDFPKNVWLCLLYRGRLVSNFFVFHEENVETQ